ncbi:MAG: hypothetical protein JAY90_18590 [Candidatus Thiodiazotropha lotti]|nr:hypothetical protein [Candidatus Thiodiazotropha lotti]
MSAPVVHHVKVKSVSPSKGIAGSLVTLELTGMPKNLNELRLTECGVGNQLDVMKIDSFNMFHENDVVTAHLKIPNNAAARNNAQFYITFIHQDNSWYEVYHRAEYTIVID